MQELKVAYAGCHARTLWYLEEIQYCLEAYFGYTAEAANHEVVTSQRLRDLVASGNERLMWHLLPTELAFKVAKDRNPGMRQISEETAAEYQAKRYRNVPPRAPGARAE